MPATPTQPWQELPEMKPFLPDGRLEDSAGTWREVHSASTSNNLAVLQHWFLQLEPARTLEIGLAFGASATLLLAEGLDERFALHEELSCFALPKLYQTGERFGLIYVDGSHLFEDVLVDFYFASLMLETGGIIAFDDSSCGHVLKVVAFIRSNLGSAYRELSPYEVTAPRWPRLKQKVARWTNRQQLTLFQKVAAPVRDWNTAFKDF